MAEVAGGTEERISDVAIYRAPAGAEAYMHTLSSAESGRASQMDLSFVPPAGL